LQLIQSANARLARTDIREMMISENLYTFNQLNPNPIVLGTAITSYCRQMNCFGLEANVDAFLQSKLGQSIKFYEDGTLFIHEVK